MPPPLEDFIRRFPALERELRDLFPVLELLAQVGPSDPAALKTAGTSPPPRLGEYSLLREIGRGGMGVVFEAEQESLGRRVALKVLPRHAHLDPRPAERFRREAKAAARLHHTNIVPVFGVGEAEGVHFYAMQYINGRSLDRIITELRRLRAREPGGDDMSAALAAALAGGRLGLEALPGAGSTLPLEGVPGRGPRSGSSGSSVTIYRAAARVAQQAALGLAHAHAQGVVHRDIKPSNLILDPAGTVWVGDFGLAQAEGSETLTLSGDIVGTLRYMAPERFEGKSSAAVDTYALGLTLLELVTLEPAFPESDRGRLVSRITKGELRRPRLADPRIPADFENIVVKAVAREPGHRYATAQDMADDLARFIRGEPVRARPLGGLARTWRWCRRNPIVAALITLASALLLTTAVVSTGAYVTTERARGRAEENERRTRWGLYDAHMRLAAQSWTEGHIERVAELLERYAPRTGEEDLRRFEWFYLHGRLRGGRTALRGHVGSVLSAGFSPGGSALLTGSIDGSVVVWDAASLRPERVLSQVQPIHCAAFSPDRAVIAAGGGYEWNHPGTLAVWDAASGRKLRAATTALGVQALCFSPDGSRLAVAESGFWDLKGIPGVAEVLDAKNLSPLFSLTGHTAGVTDVEFTPDGKILATSSWDGCVRLFEADGGSPVATLFSRGGQGHALAISPDGSLLASTGDHLEVWSLRERSLLCTAAGGGFCIAFSPDGSVIAEAGLDEMPRLYDARTGKSLGALRGHRNWIWSVAFSPDGRKLLTGDRGGIVTLWDLGPVLQGVSQNAAARFRSHNQFRIHALVGRRNIALSPAGRLLAIAAEDNSVSLHDLEGSTLPRRLAGHSGRVNALAFSPDERTLASGGSEGLVAMWDVETGARRIELSGHRDKVTDLALGRQAGMIVTGGLDQSVRIWDAVEGREVRRFDTGARIVCVTVDSGGTRVAAATTEQTGHLLDAPRVLIWDASTGNLLWQRTFPGLQSVCDVAFGGDGSILAVAGGSTFQPQQAAAVLIFEAAGGRQIASLRGHFGFATAVAFAAPDTLATLGAEGSFRLWDTRLWEERSFFRWEGHTRGADGYYGNGHMADALAMSADGRVVALGSPSGDVDVWRAASAPDADLALERDRAWSAFQAARRAMLAKRWDEAEVEHTRALELGPGEPWVRWARHFRSLAYEQLGRHAESREDLTMLCESRPPDYRHRGRRGIASLMLGKRDAALSDLEEAFRMLAAEAPGVNVDPDHLLQWLRGFLAAPLDLEAKRKGLLDLLDLGMEPEVLWSLARLGAAGDVEVPAGEPDVLPARLYARAVEKVWPGIWEVLRRGTPGAAPPDGGLLIGARANVRAVGAGAVVTSLAPVLLTSRGQVVGSDLGGPSGDPVSLVARPGYAVAGILVEEEGFLGGFQLVFTRIRAGGLDLADQYRSPWIGGEATFEKRMVWGQGHALVGIAGAASGDVRDLRVRAIDPLLPDWREIDAALDAESALLAAGAEWKKDEAANGRVFQRTTFTLDDPAAIEKAWLELEADVELTASLNGVQVGAFRWAEAEAWSCLEPRMEQDPARPLARLRFPIPPSSLRAGQNSLEVAWTPPPAPDPGPGIAISLKAEASPLDPSRAGEIRRLRDRLSGAAAEARLAYLEGRLLEARGDHAGASTLFERACGAEREAAAPWLRLVDSLLAAGDVPGAEGRLKEALSGPAGASRRLWDLWLRVSFSSLRRSAPESLVALPAPGPGRSNEREAVCAYLEGLAAGHGVRINCGGGTAGGGPSAWSADRFFASGRAGYHEVTVAGGAPEEVHRTERSFAGTGASRAGYRIPLPPGRYAIKLHLPEVAIRRPGRRLFDVLVEGTEALVACEPLTAGFAAVNSKELVMPVTDGILDIDFQSRIGAPQLGGIEIHAAAELGKNAEPLSRWSSRDAADLYTLALRRLLVGDALAVRRRWGEAALVFDQAAATLEALARADPERDVYRRDLAGAWRGLELARSASGSSNDARRASARATLLGFETIDAAAEGGVELIPPGALWRFFRGMADPSPGLEWTQIEFDDASWEAGASGFGYGNGDSATALTDMAERYTTVYFRRAFEILDPAAYGELTLSVVVDDGFVAYLNGQELGRHNGGPAGTRIPFDGVATGGQNALESRLVVDPALLVRGRNVLALQGLNFTKRRADHFTLAPALRCGRQRADQAVGNLRALRAAAEVSAEEGVYFADYLEARLLELEGRPEDAVKAAAQAVRRGAARPEPREVEARLLRSLGRKEEAMAAVREHLQGGGKASAALWRLWYEAACVDLRMGAGEALSAARALLRERGGAEESGADLLSALAELASSGALRIDCGAAGDIVSESGVRWVSDRFFVGPSHAGESALPIEETVDDSIYGTERSPDPDDGSGRRSLRYRIPAPPAGYILILHFAEVSMREPAQRAFDILIEGEDRLSGFEPLAEGFARAIVKTFDVTVEDGWLDLELRARPGSPQGPQIAAIALLPRSGRR